MSEKGIPVTFLISGKAKCELDEMAKLLDCPRTEVWRNAFKTYYALLKMRDKKGLITIETSKGKYQIDLS